MQKHTKEQCSVHLEEFINYIATQMLVVDTRHRVGSNEVYAKLKTLAAPGRQISQGNEVNSLGKSLAMVRDT